jgi:hypothetical protein
MGGRRLETIGRGAGEVDPLPVIGLSIDGPYLDSGGVGGAGGGWSECFADRNRRSAMRFLQVFEQ